MEARIGCAYVDPATTLVQEDAVEALPKVIAEKLNVLPIYKIGETLTMLSSDPRNAKLVQQLTRISMHEVSLVFALPDDIRSFLQVHYSTDKSVEDVLQRASDFVALLSSESAAHPQALSEGIFSAQQIIEFVDTILHHALRIGASDVHLEPCDGDSLMRYRIDGELRHIFRVPQNCIVRSSRGSRY